MCRASLQAPIPLGRAQRSLRRGGALDARGLLTWSHAPKSQAPIHIPALKPSIQIPPLAALWLPHSPTGHASSLQHDNIAYASVLGLDSNVAGTYSRRCLIGQSLNGNAGQELGPAFEAQGRLVGHGRNSLRLGIRPLPGLQDSL
jgi:hypothetical protein